MATMYLDNAYQYSANCSDGTSFGSVSFGVTAGIGFVPQEVLDAAARAFIAVVNDWMPATDSSKSVQAGGSSDWSWTAPAAGQ